MVTCLERHSRDCSLASEKDHHSPCPCRLPLLERREGGGEDKAASAQVFWSPGAGAGGGGGTGCWDFSNTIAGGLVEREGERNCLAQSWEND